ncbi:protein DMR6-LIKE OXYGENASE 2-like [Iris pallida]|uniref:Protein DMR6-LIKE OXYGENASE 2-like n=1 Tax=Iris pallida TaxID=29817 RepID=A0AAX6GHL2_IRIPA|nr:protein DMR6-LIKE OXYGENASE 2-like [Iris pallida]
MGGRRSHPQYSSYQYRRSDTGTKQRPVQKRASPGSC